MLKFSIHEIIGPYLTLSMSIVISDACRILDSKRMISGSLQAISECISFFLPVHIVNLPRPLILCLGLILQCLLVAEHSSQS